MAYRRQQNGFFKRDRRLGAAIDARVTSLSEKLLIEYIWDQTLGLARKLVWRCFSDDELAEVCTVTRQGIHKALDRLMSDEFGWISRRPAAHDKRSWEYRVHTENFERGPQRAKRECRPRADAAAPATDMSTGLGTTPVQPGGDMQTGVDILSAAEMANPTWQKLRAECAYACECPYLLKKFKEETSTSSDPAGVTTAEVVNGHVACDVAGNGFANGESGNAECSDRGQVQCTGIEDAEMVSTGRRLACGDRERPEIAYGSDSGRNGENTDAFDEQDAPDACVAVADKSLSYVDTASEPVANVRKSHKRVTASASVADDRRTYRRVPQRVKPVCPDVVAAAVRKTLGPADQAMLDRIWRETRSIVPDADEVAWIIGQKAGCINRNVRRPHAYLLQCLLTDLQTEEKRRDLRASYSAQKSAVHQQAHTSAYYGESFEEARLRDPSLTFERWLGESD